jgi:hypothetical protein
MTDTEGTPPADTFGVSIGVDDDAFRFLVHVPSGLEAAWNDRDTFQQLVEAAVWSHLDRESTLHAVGTAATAGERVELGTVTLTPEGTVVEHTLTAPEP